jgi:beta-mannanase
VVDVIGFNSFNFGDCSTWPKWETYDDIYLPYLERLHRMAPEKPIIVSSLGTVEQGGDKDQWLTDTYRQLVDFPKLRAVVYFNRWEVRESLGSCPDGADYRVYTYPSGKKQAGFLEAIDLPEVTYFRPGSVEIREFMFDGRTKAE